MTTQPVSSAEEATWEIRRVSAGGREHLVRVLPAPGAYRCLPDRPALALSRGGEPRFALTLLLDGEPSPVDPEILPLVNHGFVSLAVTATVSQEIVDALAVDLGTPCEPLFAQATLALTRSGRCLAETSVAGCEGALATVLERGDALAALASVQGGAAALTVTAALSYRIATAAVRVRLTGRWRDVDAALRRRAHETGGVLARGHVESELVRMLAEGTIRADGAIGAGRAGPPPDCAAELPPDPAILAALVRAAAAFLLRPVTGGFVVRDHEPGIMALDVVAEATGVARQGTVLLGAPLGAMLQAAGAVEPDRLIGLVALGGDTATGLRAVPRLVRSAPRAAEPRMVLVDSGSVAVSRTLALSPSRMPQGGAHALLAGDAVGRFGGAGLLHAWVADDVVVADDGAAGSLNLPVVGDVAAGVYPDKVDPRRGWYAPRFDLVAPAPGDDPATSPFRFAIMSTGSVVADGGLDPGLDGEVVLTLRPAAPDIPTASPVPVGSPSVILEIPYRDAGDSAARTNRFTAAVEQAPDGTLTVRGELLDEWVRLAYGALSYPGFQTQPARVRIAYTFRAYMPIADPSDLEVVFGSKLARREAATTAESRDGSPRLRLRPDWAPGDDPPDVDDPLPHHGHGGPVGPLVPGRRPRYVLRTIVREQVLDVVLPCSDYGGFYLRRTPDGEAPLGCQDVLRLGETDYRQYEELGALATPTLRVFRSLQQPGRFLVLPAAYRITRYAADESPERAFRPVILLYGIVDRPPAPDRYFLGASLQPDIAPYEVRELRRKLVDLTPYGHEPVLQYPTDPAVQATPSFAWALPAGIDEPEVAQVWDTFQVNVSTGLANALALTTLIETTGLQCGVQFALPSGVRLSSRLVLDTRIAGPWPGGPVTVDLGAGGAATLVNRCEQPVRISELVVGADDRRVPVDATLAPGGSVTVPAGGDAADVCVDYSQPPAGLELRELRVFVEDVKADIVLVNLLAYANHSLASLEVGLRLQATDHVYSVVLREAENGEVAMTLPLTSYLQDQVLEFQLIGHRTTGEAVPGPWRTWDLARQGTVISLTPDLI